MKRRLFLFPTVVLLTLLLASCANFNPLGFLVSREYYVSTNPGYFRYTAEVTDGGIQFVQNPDMVLSARAASGSIGATFTGYQMAYYYADGQPIYPGDNSVGSGSLAARIPPGLSCPTAVSTQQADDGGDNGSGATGTECTTATKGVQYVVGPQVQFATLPGVPIQIAAQLFCDERPDTGAYALVTIYGRDDLGREFNFRTSKTEKIPLVAAGVSLPVNATRPEVCELR